MGIERAGTISIGGARVPRLGFGTMRLTGPHIFGPPADRAECVRVVRAAYDAGVRVFDTAWYYGPDVANEIVREALHPYPDDVLLVGKLGGARSPDAAWVAAMTEPELREGCERDLRTLGVEAMDVVHLRWIDGGTGQLPFEGALAVLADLQAAGKIRHLGLSTVTREQLDVARAAVEVVTVSNAYGPLNRVDEAMVRACEELGIAYLPYFPLSLDAMRFGVAASDPTLTRVGEQVGASPVQVALAWLLARSPALVPIPGTSSTAHLADNLAAADLQLPADALAALDAALADPTGQNPPRPV